MYQSLGPRKLSQINPIIGSLDYLQKSPAENPSWNLPSSSTQTRTPNHFSETLASLPRNPWYLQLIEVFFWNFYLPHTISHEQIKHFGHQIHWQKLFCLKISISIICSRKRPLASHCWFDKKNPLARQNFRSGRHKQHKLWVESWVLLSLILSRIFDHIKLLQICGVTGYLKRIYNYDNSARRFQLKSVAQYTYGDKSIQHYFSRFVNLWTKYTALKHADIKEDVLAAIQKLHDES